MEHLSSQEQAILTRHADTIIDNIKYDIKIYYVAEHTASDPFKQECTLAVELVPLQPDVTYRAYSKHTIGGFSSRSTSVGRLNPYLQEVRRLVQEATLQAESGGLDFEL